MLISAPPAMQASLVVGFVMLVAFAQAQIPSDSWGTWTGYVQYSAIFTNLSCCPFTPVGPPNGLDGIMLGDGSTIHGGVQSPAPYISDFNVTIANDFMNFTAFSGGARNPDTFGCNAGINGYVTIRNVGNHPNQNIFPGCYTGFASVGGFGDADAVFQGVPTSFSWVLNGAHDQATVKFNLLSQAAWQLSHPGTFSPCPGNDSNAALIPNTCFQFVGTTTQAFNQWYIGPFARQTIIYPSSSSSTRAVSSSAGSGNAASTVQSSFTVVGLTVVAALMMPLLVRKSEMV